MENIFSFCVSGHVFILLLHLIDTFSGYQILSCKLSLFRNLRIILLILTFYWNKTNTQIMLISGIQQWCNICIDWNDEQKSSYHLPPAKVNTVLLFSPCCTSYLHDFIMGNLYFLTPWNQLGLPNPSLLWQPPIYSLQVWILFCFLDSICKWNYVVFILLCPT